MIEHMLINFKNVYMRNSRNGRVETTIIGHTDSISKVYIKKYKIDAVESRIY